MNALSDKAVKTRLTLHLTNTYLKALDHFVDEGIYMERQTVIRAALRHFFRFHGIGPFSNKEAELDIDNKPKVE